MSPLTKTLTLAAATMLGASAPSAAEAGGRHRVFKHTFVYGSFIHPRIVIVKPACGFWKLGTYFPCTVHYGF